MIYLILSILFTSSLTVIFKLAQRYNVSLIEMICFNYVTCAATGLALEGTQILSSSTIHQPWFLIAISIGFMFIIGFFIIGKTTQENGISIAAISSKLSLAIPTIFGFFLYHESITAYKIVGLVLALIAVILSAYKPSNNQSKGVLIYPILCFLSSGLIDTVLKFAERNYVTDDGFNSFLLFLFASAGFFGLIYYSFLLITGKQKFELKGLLFGILLGLPNYWSIYFLIKALKYSGLESSAIFPINNLSIVLLGFLIAFIAFHEKFSKINLVGIVLAIVSISILSLNI